MDDFPTAEQQNEARRLRFQKNYEEDEARKVELRRARLEHQTGKLEWLISEMKKCDATSWMTIYRSPYLLVMDDPRLNG